MHLTLMRLLGLKDWMMGGTCYALEGGGYTDPGNLVNAYLVPEFCRRNRMGVTTAYKANKAGLLEFTKQFGKTVITVEAEAKFRQLAAEGKLVWPKKAKENKPGPVARAAAKRGRRRNSGTDALGAA